MTAAERREAAGRRKEDITNADILDELRKIEAKVEPLASIAQDVAQLKELAEIWRGTKALGRGVFHVGRGVRFLATVAAAAVALWAMAKGFFAVKP